MPTQFPAGAGDFQRLLNFLGGRWTLELLQALKEGADRAEGLRYAELKRKIGLPERTLAKRLGELRSENLAKRENDPDDPRQVCWRITARGQRALELLAQLERDLRN